MLEGQGKLGCVFNKIKGDLVDLISAELEKICNRKIVHHSASYNPSNPCETEEIVADVIPPIPPSKRWIYGPSNPCETEDLIADCILITRWEILLKCYQVYYHHLITLDVGSGTPTQLVDLMYGQENVLTNLENGKIFVAAFTALGAEIGINDKSIW